MFMKKFFILFLLMLLISSTLSCSNQIKGYVFKTDGIRIALVVPGPINDSSWNEAAYKGLKRFQEDYKAKIAVVEKVSLDDAKDIFSELAERKFNLIIAHGYDYGRILKKMARMYPEVFFCANGAQISQPPNLCSFNFKDEQYGYLLGVVAGLNTSTNKTGIVVGKKMPSVENTIIGMRQGLKSVNPKADLVVSYINDWDNIVKGKEAGIAQINTGVDIITHLADTSGIGVIKAAEDADISAIGAIVDQHDLAPSTVITSGLQDASQLVYLTCEYYKEMILEPVSYRFGLKHQVIDLAPSYGNIDPTVETKINRIKNELADIEVAQDELSERKVRK